MSMLRIPVFTWTMVATCLNVLFAFPALLGALGLIFVARHTDIAVNPAAYLNLFWFYGHPVVYVMFFPFVGAVAEVFSAFCRRRLFGYEFFVGATILTFAGLSMAVWGHHMFTTGRVDDRYFALTSHLIIIAAGVEYFERAIAHVRTGLDRAGRAPDAMSYRTIALASVDRDGDRARRIVRPVMAEFLAEFADMSTVAFYGISDELGEMVKRGGAEVVAAEMPDQWLEDLALVGTPREVADKVLSWVAAGIDAIAIFLPHESERDTLTLVAQEVVPLVAESREWRA